jgi:hypothetical protein
MLCVTVKQMTALEIVFGGGKVKGGYSGGVAAICGLSHLE